jgi:hypothetical protein
VLVLEKEELNYLSIEDQVKKFLGTDKIDQDMEGKWATLKTVYGVGEEAREIAIFFLKKKYGENAKISNDQISSFLNRFSPDFTPQNS